MVQRKYLKDNFRAQLEHHWNIYVMDILYISCVLYGFLQSNSESNDGFLGIYLKNTSISNKVFIMC